MKVKELIEYLKTFDGNLDVAIKLPEDAGYEFDYRTIDAGDISVVKSILWDEESDEEQVEKPVCVFCEDWY